MKEELLRELYQNRGRSLAEADEAVGFVQEFEAQLETPLDDAEVEEMRAYMEDLIERGQNTQSRLLALARYYYLAGRNDMYIYFTSLFGGLGVMESIQERLEAQEGEAISHQVFDAYPGFPLGTDPKEMPKRTQMVVDGLMDALPAERYRKVLAGNNHGIPAESMQREKELFMAAKNLDRYLEERHARKVEELQSYCDRNEVWYEQEISQEVVDYVKTNQEILSAVRKGNKLYVTKIPYDGIRYLHTNKKTMKSYYACHCPFAREAILSQEINVDSQWCYCSGGFAKFPFEVIFDRELEVELLQSALAGDPICRFVIQLPSDFQWND